MKLYRNKLKTDKEVFYDLLDQIKKHIIKLIELKENEDTPGHFKEEIADMHLLALQLVKLEKLNKSDIENASEHFLNKIKEIFG